MSEIVLSLIKPEEYFKGVVAILRRSRSKRVVYITTSKPYKSLVTSLRNNKLDPDAIFFVDCISKTIREKVDEATPNCVFLESPQSLNEIGIAVSESVKGMDGDRILLLDSLSTLLLYNDAVVVGQFSNFLIGKMRSLGVDTIILALESDTDTEVIQRIKAFVDEVRKNGI